MGGDASRENGKKGGRPMSEASKVARLASEKVRQMAGEHAEELFRLQMTLARGVKVADTEDGPIYQKPPDGKAIDSLMDRFMGKASQAIELNGDVDTHYTIIHEFTTDEKPEP